MPLPHHLMGNDAKRIAIACSSCLRACAAVTLSRRPLIGEIGADDKLWIVLSLHPNSTDNDLHGLRNAVETWYLLAQCAGYSPHLKTQFWIDLLVQCGVGDCDNVVGFDKGFPRFRLRVDQAPFYSDTAQAESDRVARILRRILCTPEEEPPLLSSASSGLRQAHGELDKFLHTSHGPPPVQVAVDLPSMDTACLLRSIEDLTWCLTQETWPRMSIAELSLNHRRRKPENPETVVAWFTKLHGVRCFSKWVIDESIGDAGLRHRLLCGVLVNPQVDAPKIGVLHVDRSSIMDDDFAALCSLLPSSKAVGTVRIYKDPDWSWNLLASDHDWVWLSYALLTASTLGASWSELLLDGCGIRDQDAEIMREMQRTGVAAMRRYLKLSDLLDAQNDHNNDKSVSVDLRQGMKLFTGATKDNKSSEIVVDLDTPLASTRLPVLGMTQYGFAAAVVVPGVGVGWIPGVDVARCKAATLYAVPQLRGFGARLDRWNYGSVSGLKAFIGACCTSAGKIDLSRHESLESSDVLEILEVCPHLRHIALNHDGSTFTDRGLSAQSPAASHFVSAIRLSCSLIEASFVVSSLSQITKPRYPAVRALYFHVTKAAGVFHSVCQALGGHLKMNPQLEDVVFVKTRRTLTRSDSEPMLPMDPRRMTRMIKLLGFEEHELVSWTLPCNIQHAIGLVIAIQDVGFHLISSALPSDVIESVLSFAGGTKKRRIWVHLA